MIRKVNLLCALAALILVPALALAGPVTSDPVRTGAKAGTILGWELDADSDEAVAGLNGEISWDPALFSDPVVQRGSGALGFTLLSNQNDTGKLRFVLYADPTASLNLDAPVLYFSLRVADPVTQGQQATISYSIGAAARPDGTSFLSDVDLQPVTVRLIQTSVTDWSLYN